RTSSWAAQETSRALLAIFLPACLCALRQTAEPSREHHSYRGSASVRTVLGTTTLWAAQCTGPGSGGSPLAPFYTSQWKTILYVHFRWQTAAARARQSSTRHLRRRLQSCLPGIRGRSCPFRQMERRVEAVFCGQTSLRATQEIT